MPVQSGKSPVSEALKRAGLNKHFDSHKGDETKLSAGGGLPAGIDAGVAQLVEAKIGLVAKEGPNKGKPFFYVAGVVKEPPQFAGMRTDKSFMLFGDKQESVEKAIEDSLNEMRKLGIETKGLELDDWEAALEALKGESPHFRFRTWAFDKEVIEDRNGKWYVTQGGKDKGGPYASEAALKKAKPYAGREPRVNHDWRGLATGFVASHDPAQSAVDDNTGSDQAGDNGSEEVDYLALGSAAVGGDLEASKALQAKADELGIGKEVADSESWDVAAQLILDAVGGGGDSSSTSTSEPFEPKKGNVYSLKAKGAKKFEDYECTAVFKTTINLKRLTDDKVFTKVEWTADPPQIWGQDIET